MTQRLSTRILQVTVGPPGGTGRTWRGQTGAPSLTMGADVIRTSGSKPNKAKVELYNLHVTSLQLLELPNLVLQIFAGEEVAGLIFKGDIRATAGVRTKRQGPTRITTIEASDSKRIWRDSMFVRSYPAGTTLLQVIQDIIASMTLPIGYLSPLLPPHTFAEPTTWAMRARDALTEALDVVGGRWSHEHGAVDVLAFGEQIPGNLLVLTPHTGLMGSAERTNKGVKAKCLFTTLARPNGGLRLDSDAVIGDFRLTKVRHVLGMGRKTDWRTELVGTPLL